MSGSDTPTTAATPPTYPCKPTCAHPPPPTTTHQAILAATQRSFSAIKRRVGSHASTGIFFLERPFFDVNVELKVRRR